MKREQHTVGNITSIVNPTDDDLIICGELLGIDIHHSSFSVRYQHVMTLNLASQHVPRQRVYPLSELRRFFLVNGNITSTTPCNRPVLGADWELDYDGPGKKPYLEELIDYATEELKKL